jgi:predicted SAM-dependent methyltransferase
MPLSTISRQRPLTSYAKIQAWVGAIIRNRRFQLQCLRARTSKYLDIGCGLNTHENFINLDYFWHPKVDICWDPRRGLPFADGSLNGIFSEHCLEHFPLPEALDLLREIRRVLSPKGIARIVVPDGELYLRTYMQHLNGESPSRFPYQDSDTRQEIWTPMLSVNRVFYQDRVSPYGHRTIFDFQLLQCALHQCGFSHAERRQFRCGADPQLLIDTPARQVESLYVEAWGTS